MPVSVLIVDDDHAFRRTARELLGARGYAVVGEAGDCNEAIAAARRLRPDAMLIDVQLPDGHGHELARELSREGVTARMLLTSSDPEAVDADLVEQVGVAGFVPKVELATANLDAYFSR